MSLNKTLPPTARVRRRADYLRVQKQSARASSAHFVFLITASPLVDGQANVRPRLGIIASKAVGNAVVRARAKRLVRAAFRELWPRYPVGIDLVVLVRGDIRALGLADVLAEWRSAEANIVRRGKAALTAPTPPPPAPRGGKMAAEAPKAPPGAAAPSLPSSDRR